MTTTAGRPRAFDEAEVLGRALDLFWRRGYRATTTRELEETLGLSQSSLYNAFGSKAALMAAVLDRYEAMTAAALIEPLENAESGLDAIRDFFDALAHWVTHDGRRGCMVINLMAEDGGDNDEIAARTAAYRARVRVALLRALERAAGAGETNVADLGVRAELLFGEVLGLNIAARGGASATELAALVAGVRYLIDSWRQARG